ncbi:MAG TPA: hypothetical protein PLR37_09725, partial [Candidatus Accumulibacter phosphatis]|nr:hypothetical protein [Candidatus Accumulibacter phosphatis]
ALHGRLVTRPDGASQPAALYSSPTVVANARAKGAENPIILVFLPKGHGYALGNAIVTLEAAKNTFNRKGTSNTEEGRDARRSMERRQRNAKKEILPREPVRPAHRIATRHPIA